MTKMRTPIGIALVLAAPLVGWFAIGSALVYSVGTPALPGTEAAKLPSVGGPDPKAAILAASRGEFDAGMSALADGNVSAAIDARDNLMPRDSIERRALTFAIVTSGLPGISSEEFKAALQTLADWPGLDSIERHYERAFYREHPGNDAILAAFRDRPPQTPEGRILLARALKQASTADQPKAVAMIRDMWTGSALNIWLENEILKDFPDDLTPADHKGRMDYLLYRDRVKQAARFAKLGNAVPLFDAWSAVIRQSKNASTLLAAAATAGQNDPAFLYAKISYLQKKEDYAGAAKLLAGAPKNAEQRINSDEWWHEQRIVSRGLFESGKMKEAYQLAASSLAESANAIADAEFHAGWFALAGLKDGKLAAEHFNTLLNNAARPASQARALYWLGRAERLAGGTGEDAFRRAARYDHTFYGLVAAAEIRSRGQMIAPDMPTSSERSRFAARAPVQAIALFEKNGYNSPARLLYRELADEMSAPGDLAILAVRAKTGQDEALALEIGKKAYAMGARDASLAYPLGAIPDAAQLSGVQLALAYAVSRQESGFNPQAVSSANAMGLMQLLPGTAKDMASQLGLAYAPDKLTDDTAYNAMLGTQYLDNQIRRHGGSYVLTFAAYNAGPAKVREWITRFGDPRGQTLEGVLNWIESIPYPETRDYVERVMENFEAYQKLLGLKGDIAADLSAGG
jgi:soluble lytic murein transglycosylase